MIVGAGFAGFHCARWLDRHLTGSAEVVLVSPGDHTIYSALLPDVVGGVVDPTTVATPPAASLPSTTVVVGAVTAVDAAQQTCTVSTADARVLRLAWNRMVLNPGSVTETFGIAGAREALGSFVVVGGGFTGLELAAQGHRLGPRQLTAQPAQHAQRQGVMAARITTPLGVRLSRVLAKLAGRAYHLLALPSGRLRVLSHRVNAAISGPQIVELGLIDERYATIRAEAGGRRELDPHAA